MGSRLSIRMVYVNAYTCDKLVCVVLPRICILSEGYSVCPHMQSTPSSLVFRLVFVCYPRVAQRAS